MSNYEAPHVNGVMELTEEQRTAIKEKLVAIQEEFVFSHEQPVCDMQYLVATYNFANPTEVINGDTAQFVLSVETVTPIEPPETPAE